MEYKIIFLDVDGTLYSHSTKSVPESTIRALKEAQSKGIKICIASGRSKLVTGFTGILDLLDKSYVESEKINADNLNKYIKSLGKYQKLYTSEIYEKNDGIKGKRFFVKGKQAIGYNKEENIDIWYVIKVNNDESRFSIIPYYEEAEVSDLENNYKNDGEILENNENFFVMKYATDDYMAKEYFYNLYIP